MTHSHLDPAIQNRVAWNAGKTVGTKRPLTQKQIWAIRFFLDREVRLQGYCQTNQNLVRLDVKEASNQLAISEQMVSKRRTLLEFCPCFHFTYQIGKSRCISSDNSRVVPLPSHP